MSIVNIDLSRFDYANESILDELYMETPIAIPDDQDFFKLELNEAYKNNTDRIERTTKYEIDKKQSEHEKLEELIQECSANEIIQISREG